MRAVLKKLGLSGDPAIASIVAAQFARALVVVSRWERGEG